MDKQDRLQYIRDKIIIAVVRSDSGDDLVRVVEAVAEGGVHCIELTMTSPGALDSLEKAARKLEAADVSLGVGTVLDPETCRAAIESGAQYIVTPTLSIPTIKVANDNDVPIFSGAYTPTEIFTAWDNGADMVKVFPADVGGPAYIKAIKGPLPQIPLVPTGGVTLDTLGPFLEAGASALGVGGHLVSKKLLAARDFNGITKNARAFADAVRALKGK